MCYLKLKIVEDKRREEFLEFCKAHPRIYYITNTIGSYNIMWDIHVNNIEEYRETLLDIKDKFSDIIRDYESIIVFEEYKISYLPENKWLKGIWCLKNLKNMVSLLNSYKKGDYLWPILKNWL